MPDTVLDSTRAIMIDAPPYLVWPWIGQFGYGRGGWYSYDRIERLVLAGRSVEGRSATRIHPEFQDIRAGDEIRISAPVKATVVSADPQRHLVLGNSWAFVLQDPHDGRTRLLVRTRGPGWVRRPVRRVPVLQELGAATDYLVGEPSTTSWNGRCSSGSGSEPSAWRWGPTPPRDAVRPWETDGRGTLDPRGVSEPGRC